LILFRPDVVFHLGEYSRVEQSFEDIEKVINSNVVGTHAVLEFVRKNNCKLIYAGSSTKFSDIGKDSSPYAWTKSKNTELVNNYGKWYGIDYAITYFYNVYGPREIEQGKYATFVASMLYKYKNNLPLTVVSPGTQKRNFTHIDDTIDALALIVEKGKGDGYGIGSDDAYSILDVVEMFGREVVMLPERDGNRHSSDLLTNNTKSLGWKCKRNLRDYIKKILR